MASASGPTARLRRPLVTAVLVATALVSGAAPAQAASFDRHYVNGAGNFGGILYFSDEAQGWGTSADTNKFTISEWRDGYGTSIQVTDKQGVTRLYKYLSDGQNGSWWVNLLKGSFQVQVCSWIEGGNLTRCTTWYPYNA